MLCAKYGRRIVTLQAAASLDWGRLEIRKVKLFKGEPTKIEPNSLKPENRIEKCTRKIHSTGIERESYNKH